MEIPEIHIPDVHIPYTYVPDYGHSNVQIIGCTYYHRDTKNTGNRNLIIEDPNGVITNCPYPSFNPLDYVPDQLTITEEMPNLADENEMPTSEPPKTEIPKKEKQKDEYKPCPPNNAPRIGSFVNDKRLERIKDYVRESNGDCTTVYEDVQFIDQYLPTPSMAVSTFFVASIAASTPLILNAIKPLTKQLIKRLSKSKVSKNESEGSPDREEQ